MKRFTAILLLLALVLALCACGASDGPKGKYVDRSTGASITFRGGKAVFEDKGEVHKYDYEMDGERIIIKLSGGATVEAYVYEAETDTVYLDRYGRIPFEKVN